MGDGRSESQRAQERGERKRWGKDQASEAMRNAMLCCTLLLVLQLERTRRDCCLV